MSVRKTPNKWKPCMPMSSELILDKFLAFKTPLDRTFEGDEKGYEFNVKSVFDYLKEKNLKMGLWIDLTPIAPRYNPEEVRLQDCQYVKEGCGMRKRPPSVTKTKRLISIVSAFIKKNPNAVIGVHCTHGHNRTGFMIVAFMVEIFNIELESAIAEFARVRPPGIYRDYLLAEIRKIYGGKSGPSSPMPRVKTKLKKIGNM